MTHMPKRLQRSRRRGYVMPQRAVYVGRPTVWGNPFRIEAYDIMNAEGKPVAFDLWRVEASKLAVADYREALIAGRLPVSVGAVRHLLAGKDLVCWCALSLACHVDVLLEISNTEAP